MTDATPFRLSVPRPLFDAADPGAAQLGDLPEWNLDDLYPGMDSDALTADLDRLAADCASFAADYEGRIAKLDAAGLLQCIRRYEAISETAGRIMSYAGLLHAQDTTDPVRGKFLSDMQGKVNEATTALVFFSLEMNRVPDQTLEAHLAANADLARYKPVLDRLRKMKPHQLSDELEHFLHDQGVVGASAWVRLFDETMAGLRFAVDGEEKPLEATLDLLSDHDRATREKGARALVEVFGKNVPLFARITNTLAKEKEIEDRWRKLPTPQASRHLANDVEPEVVQALRDAVVAAYPRLSHRYYRLKAKWLGLDKLQVWDRNAPLPIEEPRVFDWDAARDTVMTAYSGFDPRMAEIAQPFFEKGWIDAAAKPGKSPGAFAHPTVVSAHPYILLNYLGKPRDVMTLAHELGHGVHQVLAADQGELLSSTPLTLAETASVFGEMLTFQKMLAEAPSKNARKAMLASKVEDMINTVVRQISFYEFETRVHAGRRDGELTPDQIDAHWMEVSRASLGDAFEFMDGYEHFWSYVPHFIHSPFYVYAYAFGDGLVNALYAVYAENGTDFQDKYFEMLKAGGSKHHKELLAPFGLDASDPAFWDKGLSMIEGFIDELEAMED
ncbi:M3 family oligoendopeptidase [Rhodobacteraceae bacterium 2CG4]|uniref:M3 family oligoendopeptidase n=1 Tax=Halovulum marinum TaxID=2662447 RepID=A0A6L5YXQ1_9RHOB|nr:M3 family oligoendopeptidase [Halovulum marinum]MSU88595.1 M3 family oligoendopeptidase [Halovulum marinum]